MVTDSGSRWNEIVVAQHREQGIVNYPWNSVIRQLDKIPIDRKMVETYRKSQGHFSTVRRILKSLDCFILDDERDTSKLALLSEQTSILMENLELVTNELVTNKLKVISPSGGIYDSNVQRLLARSSCPKYDDKVRAVYGIGIPV